MKETLKQKLEYLKKQQDDHTRLAVERKIFLRNRKIRFFGKRSHSLVVLPFNSNWLTCMCLAKVTTFSFFLA